MLKKNPKENLKAKGLEPKKSFGQNFMMDHNINEKFAQAAHSLGPDLVVIEIGAGTGSLTAHLLKYSSKVHAVERDRDLVPLLHEEFSEAIAKQRLSIHEADGVRLPLENILEKDHSGVLLGNLPYHLSSSIFIKALKAHKLLEGAVFLIQKEVAERLLAQKNTKDYGFLTVVMGLFFRPERVLNVSRTCFWPVPNVDSTIIKLKNLKAHSLSEAEIENLIIFVRSIFQKRRKKLSTILGPSINLETWRALGIDPNLRPENLGPEEFLKLYKLSA